MAPHRASLIDFIALAAISFSVIGALVVDWLGAPDLSTPRMSGRVYRIATAALVTIGCCAAAFGVLAHYSR